MCLNIRACGPTRRSRAKVSLEFALLAAAICFWWWLFQQLGGYPTYTQNAILPKIRPVQVLDRARRRFDLYITFMRGGLGNIMFEYASVLGLATRHNKSFAVSLTDATSGYNFAFMNATFELGAVPVERVVPGYAELVHEVGWGVHDARTDKPAFFTNRSLAFYGYRQSWKYFSARADAVRRAFRFKPELRNAAARFLASKAREVASRRRHRKKLFIGVHIRRGDMLNFPNRYAVAPTRYVLEAVDVYHRRYGGDHDLIFVVATNDRGWSSLAMEQRSARAGDSVVFTSFNTTLDLAVLSACNHSIVTVGTFGWWAGWLAGGDVVYYKGFIQPWSDVYASYRAADYYPPWWTGLD